MYCSHCGAKAANKFCANCGQPLDGLPANSIACVEPVAAMLSDWREETRYDELLRHSAVRERIEAAASGAKKGMTGEAWLELFDKAYEPLVGIKLSTVASIVNPLYARLGIQTGKERSEWLDLSIGVAIVNALCSLARYNRTLKTVHPASDGCVIEATLPSDIWSFAGDLIITIQQRGTGAQIDAATKIPGQFYDWGKSAKCLEQLFDDLRVRSEAA